MSAERVLVDTSVWIEYFRGGDPAVTGTVEALIKGGAVVTTGIILAELLQGARSDREVEIIEDMKNTFEWISLERTDDGWIRAGKLSRDLRRAGNAVHLTDCLIAVLAVENRCRVASLDAHFRMIAEVLPIEPAL